MAGSTIGTRAGSTTAVAWEEREEKRSPVVYYIQVITAFLTIST